MIKDLLLFICFKNQTLIIYIFEIEKLIVFFFFFDMILKQIGVFRLVGALNQKVVHK